MMMDRYRMLAVVCGGLVLFCLCGGAAGQTARFELRLERGDTFYQRTVTQERIRWSPRGNQKVLELSHGVGLKLEVLDVDPRGNMRVAHNCLWSAYSQSGAVRDVRYDSSKKVRYPPQEAEGFAALLGQTYVVEWTPQGRVADINDVDEMREAVQKQLATDIEGTAAMATLAAYLDAEAIREASESLMAFYPDKPVGTWDRWNRQTATAQGYPANVESTWTLMGVDERDIATVDIASKVKSLPDASPLDFGVLRGKCDFSGTQQGAVKVDLATGRIVQSEVYLRVSGDITVVDPRGNETKMPLAVERMVTTRISEEEFADW